MDEYEYDDDDDDDETTAVDGITTPPNKVDPVIKPPRSTLAHSVLAQEPTTSTPSPSLAKLIRNRELSFTKSQPSNKHIASRFLPDTTNELIESPVYNGAFSQDGSFFYACTREFMIHLYDTSNGDFTKIRSIQGEPGRWTITCCSFSPDNRIMAYSSITPVVYLAKVGKEGWMDDHQIPLSFLRPGDQHLFGIWSIRFSSDGKELVAGGGNSDVYLYDVERRKVVTSIANAHNDDVNAVCFADSSSNVVISGSDDSTCKVWDRRSLATTKDPTGVFVGHTEGITYVASKDDGRHVLSNGKDQTMKLWDLRKMVSAEKFNKDLARIDLSKGFDYRWMPYPGNRRRHPHDVSVHTYTGHTVLKTLIRCHFSPEANTGRRYVYSGSADGRVYIWTLEGELIKILNVTDAFKNDQPQQQTDEDEWESERDDEYVSPKAGNLRARARSIRRRPVQAVTRDVAWHPYLPIIASSSWLGYNESFGAIVKHEAHKV